MQYRKFGRLPVQVSALGFGCMRLPIVGTDSTAIDEPEATRMLRHAIDQGVNYVDTAYNYHGGNSERFLSRALQDGYRQKVYLADKMPVWLAKKAGDFDRLFDEQLERLQVEHIDFYLLHSLNHETWRKAHKLGVLKWGEGLIRQGKIGYLGFSFHDTYEVFQEIVDAYDGWHFCQIQYNYLDVDVQAGTKGLRYAADRGLGVVVMEPLRGGRLAAPPPAMREVLDSAPTKRTPADWGLQWVWNQPEVSVVLSGMATMQHVVENLASAERSGPGVLSPDDLALLDRAREALQGLCPIPCTECRYCMPCPNGVLIPIMLGLYNLAIGQDELEMARDRYRRFGEAARASACIECGECEELCPQGIPISEWMPKIDAVLGQGKDPDEVSD